MVIFISHIHEDRDLAISLKLLVEASFPELATVFVSSHDKDIRLGDEWFKEVELSLRESHLVFLLLSPQSVARPWINFEAGGAWFMQKKVIPVCVKGLAPDELPPPFSMRQGIAFVTHQNVGTLLSFISELVEKEPVASSSEQTLELAAPSESLPNAPETPLLVSEVRDRPIAFDSVGFVSNRFAHAFPGVRGHSIFDDPRIIMQRLGILLAQPLSYEYRDGKVIPFWWFRGSSCLHIDSFQFLSEIKCLMDVYEIIPSRALVYRDFGRPEREFLYIQTSADDPTGIYDYSEGLLAIARRHHERGLGRFVAEEFGLWKEHPISRQEYDDGAAMIGDQPVPTPGARLRIRYLTPYNLVVTGQRSVFNNPDIEDQSQDILDRILEGLATLKDLIDLAEGAPRPRWFDRAL